MALYENINRIAVLIDRPIQLVSLSLHGDKDFVDMPGIPSAPLSFFKFTPIGRSKLQTPLANGFIIQRDSTFS